MEKDKAPRSGERFFQFIFPLELPIRSRRRTKFFFTDLGALALSLALVGIGERALENECHRFDFHTDWSPTERAMFDSLFRGPILAVLHFPVFWWSRIYFSVGGLQLPLWATGQTARCHIEMFFPRFGLEWPPAASGPQKSTPNRIFGAMFNKFHQIPL